MLYHFSEDPSIKQFIPRTPTAYPDQPPMVWAIDEERSPLYFFPRDCPRVAFWSTPDSTKDDIKRFLAHTNARMVIVVEGRWLKQIQETKLYMYHLSSDTFECFDEGAGYYTSLEPVKPLLLEPVDDLLQKLIKANVEIRITPSLFPLHDELIASTLHFSMIRMKNVIR
jgi:hypothetical protein